MILDATVTIAGEKFRGDPVVYANNDLSAGVILSSPAENDYSVDAFSHGQIELGTKTVISINGQDEVIYTSCSTPFVAGKRAPLDNPKSDPLPNWFVVDFYKNRSRSVSGKC